jgi:hypothetical protein
VKLAARKRGTREIDPTNDLIFVGMIQRRTSPDNHPQLYRTHQIVYGALVDPGK